MLLTDLEDNTFEPSMVFRLKPFFIQENGIQYI